MFNLVLCHVLLLKIAYHNRTTLGHLSIGWHVTVNIVYMRTIIAHFFVYKSLNHISF